LYLLKVRIILSKKDFENLGVTDDCGKLVDVELSIPDGLSPT